MRRPWNLDRRMSRLLALGAVLPLLLAEALYADVGVQVAMSDSCIPVNQRLKGYVRVALVGERADASSESAERHVPANVALVLDRSGSMQGAKLSNVQEAAILMLDRMDANDIVSLVAYDDQIDVLVPATKLADRDKFRTAIRGLYSRNNTALYAGVVQGIGEVQKFLDKEHVNRVVLLSDGLANVGPSSPAELGALGASAAQSGISITTIGVGVDFNENLMATLAAKSDGNHLFAERPQDVLTAFAEESQDIADVVAKNLSITLTLDPHIHPIRAMGREASVQGQTVYAGLGQLTAGQTKYILLEVDIDPCANGVLPVASAKVEYVDMLTNALAKKQANTQLVVTESPDLAKTGEDRDVMECVIAQLATESNESAVRLRDTGQVQQSRQVLEENARVLRENAAKYNSPALEDLGKANSEQATQVADPERWKALRKSMTKGQYDVKQQTGK